VCCKILGRKEKKGNIVVNNRTSSVHGACVSACVCIPNVQRCSQNCQAKQTQWSSDGAHDLSSVMHCTGSCRIVCHEGVSPCTMLSWACCPVFVLQCLPMLAACCCAVRQQSCVFALLHLAPSSMFPVVVAGSADQQLSCPASFAHSPAVCVQVCLGCLQGVLSALWYIEPVRLVSSAGRCAMACPFTGLCTAVWCWQSLDQLIVFSGMLSVCCLPSLCLLGHTL
jgi:hypothetical protein